MKKINRKQLRKIINEAVKLGSGGRTEIYDNPDATDDEMYLGRMGSTPYSIDDSTDIMDVVDIDHETGIEEIPPEEDAGEMARYHALNSDRDETLYRDNPDYRSAYDEMNESKKRKKIEKEKEEELNQWYYGHDNEYEKESEANWFDVGADYHELSLNSLVDEDYEEDSESDED